MSAFEWYASLFISTPIPSNESWTLSEKVAVISQAACRQELGQGGLEGRWTALLQTLQYHAIHAGIMPEEGDTKQAIDLARIDSKIAVYRSPAQSPQFSS